MNEYESSSTISKVGDVLESLARLGRPATLNELSDLLAYPKPTLRRLLLQLMATGMVQQDLETRRYRLGRRLITLAAAVLDQMDIRREASPLLHDLMQATNESVYLTILDGSSIVYVDVVESNLSVKIVTKVGTRRPTHSTATGKVIAAFLPPEVQQGLLQGPLEAVTPHTITDPSYLAQEFEQIQKKRIAVSIDEAEVGVVGVAAPVFDQTGACIAAVGVAIPKYRFSQGTKKHIISKTLEVASKLSIRMGAPSSKVQLLA